MLKKSTWLALGFAAVSLPSAFSQNVIFSETFNNGIPANFSLFDVDAATPHADVLYTNSTWITRPFSFFGHPNATSDTVAISTSWFTTSVSADDWMFTPAIAIPSTGAYELHWNGISIDATTLESYEVRIMTAAPTVANITTSTTLQTVTNEPASWQAHSIAIPSSYAGQSVYIAFRNISNEQYILAIDDIEVKASPTKDVAALAAATTLEYTQYPLSQFPTQQINIDALITNLGNTTIDTVRTSALVLDLTTFTPIGAPNGGVLNLAAGDTIITRTAAMSAPASIGFYTGFLIASAVGDIDNTNDTTFIRPWEVTDTVYARDQDNFDYQVGVGGYGVIDFGNTFEIVNADTATSISVYFTNSDANTHATARIWATDNNGVPTTVFATSLDTVTMVDGWQTFRLPTNTILPVGDYVVSVVELDSALALGGSSADFIPGVSWLGIDSLFDNIENVNQSRFVFGVRLNLGRGNTLISVNEVANNNNISVTPNPSNGVFNVRLDLQEATDAELVVTSINGTQLRREQLGTQSTIQHTIDLSELANGMYILQVRTTKGTYTKRITKQ